MTTRKVYCQHCFYHERDLGVDVCVYPVIHVYNEDTQESYYKTRICDDANPEHACSFYAPSIWVRFWKIFGLYRGVER